MKCNKCGYYIYKGTTCPLCGYENSNTSNGTSTEGGTSSYKSNYEGEVSIQSAHSMKWYKFLKVILWFNIISNVVSAFMYFTGSIYQGLADEAYEMLPSLKSLDTFSGIFSIAMVVVTFLAWHGLHNYKSRGPKILTEMYILNIVFLIIYTFSMSSIIGGAETTTVYGNSYVSGGYIYQEYLDLSALEFQPTNIVSIISGIVFAIANHIYFKNRSDMFVN